MTAPIMEVGRWAVLRNGNVAGPMEVNTGGYAGTHPWLSASYQHRADGMWNFIGDGDDSEFDIIATLLTRAEAEVLARITALSVGVSGTFSFRPGEVPVAVAPAPAVDWEQRRWDAAKENMAAILGRSGQIEITWFSDIINISISAADALIAALKGEKK